MAQPTPLERFLAKVVEQPNGCWYWGDGRTYGRFMVDGRLILAHRWAFEHWRGPIPEGLVLDHVFCDTPCCANPWHVEPTTNAANISRSNRLLRGDHCPLGHPFESLPGDRGDRRCRLCRRRRARERYAEIAGRPVHKYDNSRWL